MPDDRCDHDRGDQQQSTAAAYPFYEYGQALTEKVAKRGYHDRPKNGSRDIVNKKDPPSHHRRSSQERRENAKPGNKPCYEDRLISVTLEVVLHVLEPFWREENILSKSQENSPAITMTDSEPDI